MRTLIRLLGLLFGILVAATAGLAIAAVAAKDRLHSRGGEDDDEFELVTILDGTDFASRATALRRASILSWFGGGTVDLRAASLDPAGADLEIRVLFGGIRLLVPDAWPVDRRITAAFGGVADARSALEPESAVGAPPAPTLRLTGWTAFGGVALMSAAPDLDAVAAVDGVTE